MQVRMHTHTPFTVLARQCCRHLERDKWKESRQRSNWIITGKPGCALVTKCWECSAGAEQEGFAKEEASELGFKVWVGVLQAENEDQSIPERWKGCEEFGKQWKGLWMCWSIGMRWAAVGLGPVWGLPSSSCQPGWYPRRPCPRGGFFLFLFFNNENDVLAVTWH